MSKKVLIRADANNKEGLGALSRANSLAEALITKGFEVSLITQSPFGNKFFRYREVDPIYIPKGASWEDEVALIKEYCVPNETTLILFRMRSVQEYISRIDYQKLVVVNSVIDCDEEMIDLNICTYPSPNETMDPKKLLAGSDYHFIKSSIRSLPKIKVKEDIQNVLITMGGADNKKLTATLVDFSYEVKNDANYTVLLGVCTDRVGFVEKRIMGISDDFTINKNASRVEDFYNSFDVVLCHGSVACYELMHLGVPCITISTSEDQIPLLKDLHEKRSLVYAGHWNKISKAGLQQVINKVFVDAELRKELSVNAMTLVDGKGVDRIVDRILTL